MEEKGLHVPEKSRDNSGSGGMFFVIALAALLVDLRTRALEKPEEFAAFHSGQA